MQIVEAAGGLLAQEYDSRILLVLILLEVGVHQNPILERRHLLFVTAFEQCILLTNTQAVIHDLLRFALNVLFLDVLEACVLATLREID